MNIRFSLLGAALALTSAVFADVDWMVLPRYSRSGRMLLHGTRDAAFRDGQPVRIVPLVRLHTPKPENGAKYKFLRLGIVCGINEKGLACFWTNGDPTHDRNPAKKAGVLEPRAAAVAMLRHCATAKEAAAYLRRAFDRKLVCGSAIFFVADANRAQVIECSPRHFASWELARPFCIYSNCWRLPGMDDGSANPIGRATTYYEREWVVREALRGPFDERGTISVADSIRASRVNAAEANGEAFAKRRGPAQVTAAAFNRNSADSYLFEIDSEFPGELSCVYAALGPQRHTVYLPIPLAAADQLPEVLSSEQWSEQAVRLLAAANGEDPVRPELLEFERRQIADFAEARERARHLLQRDRCDEARQLLRETLARQTAETLEFLTKLQ